MYGEWNGSGGYEAFIHSFRPGRYFQTARALGPCGASRDPPGQPQPNTESQRPVWAQLRAHVPFSFRKVKPWGCKAGAYTRPLLSST